MSRQCNWSSTKCQKCFLEKREDSPLSEPHCCLQVTEHRACTLELKPQAWHHRACSLVTKGSCGWGRGQERRGLGHSPSPAIQPHSSTLHPQGPSRDYSIFYLFHQETRYFLVPKISWRPWLEPTSFTAFEALKFSPYFGCFPKICTLRVSSVHNLVIFFSSHIFTLQLYFLSKFQLHNIVLSTLVTIRS